MVSPSLLQQIVRSTSSFGPLFSRVKSKPLAGFSWPITLWKLVMEASLWKRVTKGKKRPFWLCNLFFVFTNNVTVLVAGARAGGGRSLLLRFVMFLFSGLPSVFRKPVYCFRSSSGAARRARRGGDWLQATNKSLQCFETGALGASRPPGASLLAIFGQTNTYCGVR